MKNLVFTLKKVKSKNNFDISLTLVSRLAEKTVSDFSEIGNFYSQFLKREIVKRF
jgi:hypothetical protein